jgi:hypothetical protein
MAKYQIRRMGVFSCAKIYAVVMAAFGIIIGVIYGLIFMVVGGAMMAGGARDSGAAGASSLVIGLIMMVVIPIIYGVIGFVAGAIGGVVYNVAAGFVGGLELELESMEGGGYTTPPAPGWGEQPPHQAGQQQQYPY